MNQRNYQFLVNQLEEMGFGDSLNSALKTKMQLGFEEFDLKAKGKDDHGIDNIFAPKFEQGKKDVDGEKYYFLNAVNVSHLRPNEDPFHHEFRIYRNNSLTVQDMGNLFERPIYVTREIQGEKVKGWTKLNVNGRDEEGNVPSKFYKDDVTKFDLDREVNKLNLPFANPQDKKDFLNDIKAGRFGETSMRKNGKTEKVAVTVTDQISGLVMYDSERKEIMRTNTSNLRPVTEDVTEKVESKQANKVEALPDTTKQLMNKADNPSIAQNQQSKRKIS